MHVNLCTFCGSIYRLFTPCIPLHTLAYACIPLHTLAYLCRALHTLLHSCVPLHTLARACPLAGKKTRRWWAPTRCWTPALPHGATCTSPAYIFADHAVQCSVAHPRTALPTCRQGDFWVVGSHPLLIGPGHPCLSAHWVALCRSLWHGPNKVST